MSDSTNGFERSVGTTLSQILALLALEASSVVFGAIGLVLRGELVGILERNQFPAGARESIMLGFGLAGLLAVGATLLGARLLGAAGMLRWAKACAPLIPLGLLPVLLVTEFWFRHQLEYLIILALAGLVCEASLRTSFKRVGLLFRGRRLPGWIQSLNASKRWPLAVVCAASAGYVVLTSYLTILDHYRFGTGAYDLGIFDNMMWNAMHGEPFRSSVMYGDGPGNSLAGHAEFAMLLFVPLYAIHPGAEAMLCIQAAALGGAAIPLYLFASTRLSRWGAVLIACAYLLYAPLHGAQYYDFHWLPISVPFLFILFYGLAVEKKRVVIPATLVLFMVREDLPMGLAVLGVFLVLTGARPKWGAVLAVTSASWFAIVKFVVMPHFGTWFFADLYSALMIPGEKGYGSVVKTLLSNPVFVFRQMLTEPKLVYMLHILVPLSLLPMRRPALLALAIPGAFFTIVTNWPATYSLKYHYSCHFTPYMFAAVVIVLQYLRSSVPMTEQAVTPASGGAQWRYRAALGAFLFTLLCHSAVFGLILVPSSFIGGIQAVSYSLSDEEAKRLGELESLIAMIPPDASVTATDFDVPHMSNRSKIYAIGQTRAAGEYLLVGPTTLNHPPTRKNIRFIMDAHPYGLLARAGPRTLWKQGYVSKETAREKARLFRKLGY